MNSCGDLGMTLMESDASNTEPYPANALATYDYTSKQLVISRTGTEDTQFEFYLDFSYLTESQRGGPYRIDAVYCPMSQPGTNLLSKFTVFYDPSASGSTYYPVTYDEDANGSCGYKHGWLDENGNG